MSRYDSDVKKSFAQLRAGVDRSILLHSGPDDNIDPTITADGPPYVATTTGDRIQITTGEHDIPLRIDPDQAHAQSTDHDAAPEPTNGSQGTIDGPDEATDDAPATETTGQVSDPDGLDIDDIEAPETITMPWETEAPVAARPRRIGNSRPPTSRSRLTTTPRANSTDDAFDM